MTRTANKLSLLALIVLGLAGCSSKPPPRRENPDTTNLRRIYQAYKICEDFKQRGPLDEAELKKWLGELGEPGTPDEFLMSRRDGKPFVLYYGTTINPEAGDFIVAHEKDGAEGKRYVLTTGGRITTLSDADFAEAIRRQQ